MFPCQVIKNLFLFMNEASGKIFILFTNALETKFSKKSVRPVVSLLLLLFCVENQNGKQKCVCVCTYKRQHPIFKICKSKVPVSKTVFKHIHLVLSCKCLLNFIVDSFYYIVAM